MNVKEALEKAEVCGMDLYLSVTVDTNDADYETSLTKVKIWGRFTVELWQRRVDILCGEEPTEEEEDGDLDNIYDLLPYFDFYYRDGQTKLDRVRGVEFVYKES